MHRFWQSLWQSLISAAKAFWQALPSILGTFNRVLWVVLAVVLIPTAVILGRDLVGRTTMFVVIPIALLTAVLVSLRHRLRPAWSSLRKKLSAWTQALGKKIRKKIHPKDVVFFSIIGAIGFGIAAAIVYGGKYAGNGIGVAFKWFVGLPWKWIALVVIGGALLVAGIYFGLHAWRNRSKKAKVTATPGQEAEEKRYSTVIIETTKASSGWAQAIILYFVLGFVALALLFAVFYSASTNLELNKIRAQRANISEPSQELIRLSQTALTLPFPDSGKKMSYVDVRVGPSLGRQYVRPPGYQLYVCKFNEEKVFVIENQKKKDVVGSGQDVRVPYEIEWVRLQSLSGETRARIYAYRDSPPDCKNLVSQNNG